MIPLSISFFNFPYFAIIFSDLRYFYHRSSYLYIRKLHIPPSFICDLSFSILFLPLKLSVKLIYDFPSSNLKADWKKKVSIYLNGGTTTLSYTLGDQLNIGLANQSNAAKQISKNGYFTLNIPTEEQMKQIIIGGFNSGADKFNYPESFTYELSEIIDAPVISECCLTLECQVNQVVKTNRISHIFATIKRRLVEEQLIHDQHLISQQLNPMFYMGDSYKRQYKFLTNPVE